MTHVCRRSRRRASPPPAHGRSPPCAPRIAAGEPWPLAEAFGTEPEASWGPREVLAHTAEMLPYWLGEYERVVEAGHADRRRRCRSGGSAADALRIGILERDRTLPLRELFDRIDAGIVRWERTPSLTRAATDVPAGSTRGWATMTATELRERFVTPTSRSTPTSSRRSSPDPPAADARA